MRLIEIAPNLQPHIERMAAEVLACADPDQDKRRQHRIEKLATFPSECRKEVRETVNRVIKARQSTSERRTAT